MAPRSCGIRPKMSFGQKGQALSEYAMVLLFIALVCVAAVTMLGVPVRGFYVAFNGSF
jgi:Flp pilus assembly pilin Flp